MMDRLNPRTELDRMIDEVDRLLSGTMARTGLLPRLRGLRPAIDLYDNGDTLVLKAVIPGVTSDDVDITFDQDAVTLRGRTGYVLGEEEEAYVTWFRREITRGPFSERIPLPVPVDAEHINATFDNAILTLTMPKAEHLRIKRIAVQTPTAPPTTE